MTTTLLRQRMTEDLKVRQLLGDGAGQTVFHLPLPHDYQSLYETVTGQSLKQCPVCLTGTMKLIERLASLASLLNSAPHSQLTLVAATQVIDSS